MHFTKMNAKGRRYPKRKFRWQRQWILAMRWTAVFLIAVSMHVAARTNSQMVSIREKTITYKQLFLEIKRQTGFLVSYNGAFVKDYEKIEAGFHNEQLKNVLAKTLYPHSLNYTIIDNTIFITQRRIPISPASTIDFGKETSLVKMLSELRGQVTDTAGKPLPNVTVVVKGTKTFVVTDDNGNFSISTDDGDVLEFSMVGYESNSIKVSNAGFLHVQLKNKPAVLDELIVVGYGTAKKKDFTGSVATISSKTLEQQTVSSVTQALEGAVPGLQTASGSGQPGTDAVLRIRGMGSVNASNDPLIVIDGAVTNVPLNSLNPADIASIVVSKDAASNSIYGSRAANGLILVTTKKGKMGAPTITFDIKTGAVSQGVSDFDVIRDPGTYYEYTWKGIYNYMRYNKGMDEAAARQYASDNLFTANGSSNTGNGLGNYMTYSIPSGTTLIDPSTGKLRSDAKLLYHDSWQDYFLKTVTRQEYNVNISGATDKTDYYISTGVLKNPSYVMGSAFDRYSAMLKLNTQINKWLKGGVNMSYAKTNSNAPQSYVGGATNTNIFTFMNLFSPTYPIYAYDANGQVIHDADGNVVYDMGTNQTYSPYGKTQRASFNGYSPAIYFAKDQTTTSIDYFTGRGFLEAKIWKDFKFTADLSVASQYFNSKYYGNNESGSDARDYNGLITEKWAKSQTINTTQLLNYSKDFGLHHVDALAGYEYYQYSNKYMNGSKYNMYALDDPSLDNAVRVQYLNGNETKNALEGYLSRFNYNFDSKYYFSASLRTDGSSYFRNNRWGTFWSLGGAYRISEENFLKSASSWINDLRIRGSYGVQGNNGLPGSALYAWTNTYTLSAVGTVADANFGLSASTWGDPTITWESNQILNLGVDFRFWDRVYGSIDYFRRKTVDMLLNVSYPSSAGRSGSLRNVGQLLNKGIEISLGVDLVKKADFDWSLSINASKYRTTLLEIPDNMGSTSLNGGYLAGNYLRRPGTDYFNLYMYRYAGVDHETGLGMLYKRLTEADLTNYTGHAVGDIVTTTVGSQATRFELGSATPDLVGGLSTNLRYKNVDLGIQTSWQLGGKVVSRTYQYLMGQTIGRGVHVDMLNSWSPENPNSNIPMTMLGGTNYGNWTIGGSEGQYSDFSLFSAGYFNLKSVTAGYTLPTAMLNKWTIKGLRVYLSGQNLFFKSAKKGLDPRQVIDGTTINPFNYPQIKAYTVGISLTL